MNALGMHFRRRLINYLVAATAMLVLAGGAFAAFESRQVSSYVEGVWWALSLLSGSGFVGEAPTSVPGRMVAGVLMISGFALIALVTAAISSLFISEEEEPAEQAEDLFEAKALQMLSDLGMRLDAIEVATRTSSSQSEVDTESRPESS